MCEHRENRGPSATHRQTLSRMLKDIKLDDILFLQYDDANPTTMRSRSRYPQITVDIEFRYCGMDFCILLYFKMVYVAISCIYKACMSICWVLTLFDLIWWII